MVPFPAVYCSICFIFQQSTFRGRTVAKRRRERSKPTTSRTYVLTLDQSSTNDVCNNLRSKKKTSESNNLVLIVVRKRASSEEAKENIDQLDGGSSCKEINFGHQ